MTSCTRQHFRDLDLRQSRLLSGRLDRSPQSQGPVDELRFLQQFERLLSVSSTLQVVLLHFEGRCCSFAIQRYVARPRTSNPHVGGVVHPLRCTPIRGSSLANHMWQQHRLHHDGAKRRAEARLP